MKGMIKLNEIITNLSKPAWLIDSELPLGEPFTLNYGHAYENKVPKEMTSVVCVQEKFIIAIRAQHMSIYVMGMGEVFLTKDSFQTILAHENKVKP